MADDEVVRQLREMEGRLRAELAALRGDVAEVRQLVEDGFGTLLAPKEIRTAKARGAEAKKRAMAG